MKIYTSYHAKTSELRKKGITVISISRYRPRFISAGLIEEYKDLAPGGYMLKMNQEDYDIELQKILDKLNPEKVISDLINLSEGKDIALTCYEKDRNTCHRKEVGEWLEKNLQIVVEEYPFEDKRKTSTSMPSLF